MTFKVILSTLDYRPGGDNPAEFPSRHPTAESITGSIDVESHTTYIATHAVPKAMTLAEVKTATAEDPATTLQVVHKALQTGQWHITSGNISEFSRYRKIKHELTDTGTVLLKADRLVLPGKLQ